MAEFECVIFVPDIMGEWGEATIKAALEVNGLELIECVER